MRRTPLQRRTALTGGRPLRRVTPRRPRVRDTGPSPAVRKAVLARDGAACIRCRSVRDLQCHHRRPRGAGGSRRPDTNGTQNLVTLCSLHHRHVEENREWAYAVGLLVHSWADPAAEPILTWRGWMLLSDHGTAQFTDIEEAS